MRFPSVHGWLRNQLIRAFRSKPRVSLHRRYPSVESLESLETTNLLVNPLAPAFLDAAQVRVLAQEPEQAKTSRPILWPDEPLQTRTAGLLAKSYYGSEHFVAPAGEGAANTSQSLNQPKRPNDLNSVAPFPDPLAFSFNSLDAPFARQPSPSGTALGSQGGQSGLSVGGAATGNLSATTASGNAGTAPGNPGTLDSPGAVSPMPVSGGTPSNNPPTNPPMAGPNITQTNAPPGIVPLLYSSMADDPAREVVQTAAGSQGGNPMTQAFSDAGIRYADGTIHLTQNDLESPGFGTPWGQARSWTNGAGYANTTFVGNGWVDSQMPYLFAPNNSNNYTIIASGVDAYTFTSNGGNQFFLQNTFTHNTGAQEFDLTDDTGKVLRFYDLSSSFPTAQQGSFKSITDQFGNVIQVTAHTSSGQIQEIQSSNTVGTTTITESYLYTYITSGVNTGLLSNVTLRRQTNGGAWTNIRQASYAYYDGTQSYGNTGDLMTATIQDGSGNSLGEYYYRYYVSESGGYQHALKYVFSPRSYARLLAAYSTPGTATDAQVSPYADLYLQYNSGKAVSQIVVQGAGSSLVSTNVGLGTYSYTYTASSNTAGPNNWATKTVETLPDGNTNTVYTNAYGEVLLKKYHDATSGNNWLSYNQYDSSERLIESAAPSAVTGYNDSYANLNVTLNSSSGLIHTVAYYTSTTAGETTAGGVAGYEQSESIQQGSGGTSIELNSTQYFLHTANSISVSPVATYTVYSTTTGGARTTSYSYTWFTSTTQMQSEQVTKPVISSSENGPGSADTETTFFDSLQRPIWTKDGDGFLTYTAYDQATSAMVKQINDVNTADVNDFTNLPSGWSTPSGGGMELITQMVVDGLGRTTQLTDPVGNITYTVYNDPSHEELVYPGWNTSTNMPTGPTQVYRTDFTGSYTETLTMSATPHLTNNKPDGTEAISNLQTLSRGYTNIAGQVVRSDRYFNLSGVTYSTAINIGTLNTNYYESTEDYDARGWLAREVTALGTITRQVHDGLGRTVSVWVGTNDSPAATWSPTNNNSPANMVQTVGYQYDGGGVGDSDLTQETDYPGGSQANRVTNFYFDWRDRLVASKQGVQASENDGTHRPILYYTFDNLDEVTEVQRFDGDGVTITSTNGVPNAPSASLLRAETLTKFDDEGRAYQSIVYDVNQSTGSVSSTGLTTNTFYNHRGQVIETSLPGGLVHKYQFDGAGRETESYSTDGASGTSWSNAGSVTVDNVLEQVDNQYDADGNVIFVTTRERFHNETATGALGNPTTAPKARDSYLAYYFDLANRLTATVNVGTNGGTAYTRPSTVPSSSATVLVTTDSYNAAGWIQDVVDPRGLDYRTYYDNLGRVTQTIEDYTNGTPTATTNKTTNLTYDADNHTLTLQAVETGGASETTKWIYGVTTSGGSNLNSNDILATVQYPDPSTGSPSSSYQESYTVDALGENLTFTDRAGNVHSYSNDVLGRQTADAITTLASGFDNSILRIQTAYNALSDPYTITSYNAASGGSIVNQVEDVYNGLNQLIQEYQAHSGAVNTSSTPSVQYAYNELAGGLNNSRIVSMTYPNGRVLNYNYNTGVDTTISRLSSISDTSATLESYKYLGLATVVERDHPQTNVNLTYISQSGGTGDAGDQYTGLDRFGRVVDQNWWNTSTSSSTDDFQYGYDQNSNVLYKNNTVDSIFSELYHTSGAGNGYDGLNQLSAFARGTLSASQPGGQLDTVSSPSTTESWAYDALGNFSSVTLNSTQTNRTHNQQNEVTAVGSNNLAFDKNGNTTTDDQGHSLTFDAWNRLISVKNGSTTLDAYSYDCLGRRITENPGTLRDIYFSKYWQVVEEDVSGSMQDQYVWSPVYVNAMVERDTSSQRLYVQQDANWNVTGLVNTSGSVVERYVYDPYGAVTYLTPTWGSRSSSSYSWVYQFQGGRLDTSTGLYTFQHRDYSSSLGRWMENDPIGFHAGDGDLYRFATDSPTNQTDFNGEGPGWEYTKAVFSGLGQGCVNIGKGIWKTGHDLVTMPIDTVGTAISSNWQPISYAGQQSKAALSNGTSLGSIYGNIGLNIGSLGIYSIGQGIYEYGVNGNADASGEIAGSLVFGAAVGKGFQYFSRPPSPLPPAGGGYQGQVYGPPPTFQTTVSGPGAQFQISFGPGQPALPGPPPIPQVTINQGAGLAFQNQVTAAVGAVPAGPMAGVTLSGDPYTTIPDGIIPNGGPLLEVKSGRYVSFSPQLQAQISIGRGTGAGNMLVVGPRTTVSGPTLGPDGFNHTPTNPRVFRFDPATSALTPY
jgi:RHS repeat-associated protein